uniref:3-galactosyl-N-acetylglucosaminide 4-alpha-L-fucosyltransferase FUT3 n=1 Tax=Jaculus jaculus TaxID=51337 RepID=UPI000332F818|nr:3-galactosyl-N-acetylglucosaminide 4-alpha-L-fucosyltransferase FUT3 [Jaculus jaculus]XP_044991169.1 3-galactosyl-N-acetylglucosaminide 4-alpha-L-fucosyltransferase FUT3 [Jaculus jaculus]
MDELRLAKPQCPWRHCLTGLFFQLLLAICFFSYLRVTQDSPDGSFWSGSMATSPVPTAPDASTVTFARRPLLILLWTWPFHRPVALSRCSELLPGMTDCHLTPNRSVFPWADAVIVHHREVSYHPKSQLPSSPRPWGQRWVWFSMESPSHCRQLAAMDGYFNLTMSYRSDSDIFTPYGWLEPWPGSPVEVMVNLTAKTKLAAWAVSNWNGQSARVKYFQVLKNHIQVDVYGRGHLPLPSGVMMERLAQYKFYLAFENSLHQDYITEKLWKNALEAWAVPVVLGPSRSNYERFLPADAFIHVDDFHSPQDLARYLLELDEDHVRYLNYFRWREALRPRMGSWDLAFCKACRRLQQEDRYQTVPSMASWFT